MPVKNLVKESRRVFFKPEPNGPLGKRVLLSLRPAMGGTGSGSPSGEERGKKLESPNKASFRIWRSKYYHLPLMDKESKLK